MLTIEYCRQISAVLGLWLVRDLARCWQPGGEPLASLSAGDSRLANAKSLRLLGLWYTAFLKAGLVRSPPSYQAAVLPRERL